ncbi:pilus assembly FimT family protein [Roseibacillus ishigakijimensis]|uniref:Type II secretion system protein n=1 Tax=Roseibacillus ishigakijimensis TaxID=454146 RepID=A0A934RQN8_9BACT|nr:type II secretion system protein [Roseibacillus ishigakijimensis]MBK1833319.1 type II secretion system protein [Roseibacillus ishigakijimensis]
MKKSRYQGFSLIEIIVVMGIMALLLVLGTALFRGVGRGEGREAVRSLVLGGLNNAQSRALSTGEPVALVMTPYDQGREDQLGRSFTLFEVRQDEVTGQFEAGQQLRRWAMLPERFIFSKGSTATAGGQNAYDQSNVVRIVVQDSKEGGRRTVEMPAIIFGSSGRVIWPTGEGELELHIGEGKVQNGIALATGADNNDWRKREVFLIGRQTGRARYLETR